MNPTKRHNICTQNKNIVLIHFSMFFSQRFQKFHKRKSYVILREKKKQLNSKIFRTLVLRNLSLSAQASSQISMRSDLAMAGEILQN
ncbi:MAG: hypothetical protein GY679_04195 [Mycoplasma sp.]|nr:hypothetical protein [Mycoplasma sp.]